MAVNLCDTHHGWKTILGSGFDIPPLAVRLMTDEECDKLTALLSNRSIYAHLPDLNQESDGIEWFHYVRGKRSYLFYSIVMNEDESFVGFLVFQALLGKGIRLGGAIAPEHWSKGYATLVLQGLQNRLDIHDLPYPLFADAQKDNVAVKQALEKSGWRLSPNLSSEHSLIYLP